MSSSLRLRKDLVLVEPFDPPTILVIPDEAKDIRYGKVINAGSDTDIEQGDTIAFDKAVGEKTKLDGKMLLVMKAEDVLATV